MDKYKSIWLFVMCKDVIKYYPRLNLERSKRDKQLDDEHWDFIDLQKQERQVKLWNLKL